jgi:DNA modification methylase
MQTCLPPNNLFPKNATLIPLSEIDVTDRSRTDFGDIESLAKDILKNGLIHPPTVSEAATDHTHPYILCGGERRKRACEMLGWSHLPCNIREHMPRHQVYELELMENFHRKNMIWQEQCVLIAKTHREKQSAKAADCESWGVRETGYLLGVSAAHVSHATTLTPFLLAKDPEILACTSMFSAYELLLKRRENEAASLLVKDINQIAQRAVSNISISRDDVDDIFNLGDVDVGFKPDLSGILGDDDKPSTISFDLGKLFLNVDCIEHMPKMDAECVDHVVTDPPYGIDLTQMTEIKNIENVVETHEVQQNIDMFEPFLEQSYRILRPSGYCVFWYDITHQEKLMGLANKMGFKVQRWPLVWVKLHPCLNNAPRVNFTKNMEFAMVLRKSSAAALVEPQVTSIVSADGSADRKLYDNPFAKPLAVWRFILNAIAYKGQVIFDPYAGQASSLRAVINMQMIPSGCEIDTQHFNKGMLNLQKLIKEINGN